MKPTGSCKLCSVRFEFPGINRMFCGVDCFTGYMKKNIWPFQKKKKKETDKCATCKQKLETHEINNKFCSPACVDKYAEKQGIRCLSKIEKKKRKIERRRIKKQKVKSQHIVDLFLGTGPITKKKKRLSSKDFYDSPEWQQCRYKTLKKYGRKCMCCFATGVELHVDHVKPRSKFPELELDTNNLQVLCRPCNMGKSNKFVDDFRINVQPTGV